MLVVMVTICLESKGCAEFERMPRTQFSSACGEASELSSDLASCRSLDLGDGNPSCPSVRNLTKVRMVLS